MFSPSDKKRLRQLKRQLKAAGNRRDRRKLRQDPDFECLPDPNTKYSSKKFNNLDNLKHEGRNEAEE